MINLLRIASLSVARTSLGVVALSLTLLVAWTASDLRGQHPGRAVAFAQKKPRAEEEEEAPAKAPPKKQRVEEEEDVPKAKPPKRKVIRVEEEENPKAQPGPTRPDAPVAGDLRQLAEQATHRGARTLFMELAVPRDYVVFKLSKHVTSGSSPLQRKDYVEPIPVYLGSNPDGYKGKDLTLHYLAKGKKPFKLNLTSVEYVQSYEEIAREKVREFLKVGYDQMPTNKAEYLSHFDTLVVAEQALSAVLRWHESARQTGQRSGKEWDAVESGLRKQLLNDVLLEQMDALAKSRDWEGVLKLTRRLAATYTDKDDRKSIFLPAAKLIEADLKDPTADEARKRKARERLLDLVRDFPEDPVFLPLSEDLRKKAEGLLKEAIELDRDKNDADKQKQAAEYLRQAEETWPRLNQLQAYKFRRSVEHPVLRVGVRGGGLPKYFSPGWACTDTEQRAVELLFESLVKLVPDEAGIFRYRPGLAEYRPKVVPLGRHFQLPRDALWSDNQRVNSSDVRFTVGQLKTGVGLGRSRAWGELLDQVEVKSDAYQVTLRLHQGYLDPLALMTFKILPNRQRLGVDTDAFAMNPVTSGPFRLDTKRHSDDNDKRECAFFLANPSYGTRASKAGLPRIQEVRFYLCGDPVEELCAGKLDMVLDLTADEADKLRQKASNFDIEVPLRASAVPNRRIYFLAINQAKLPDANVRKALAYAINREKLLDEHFRGPLKRQVHKALNGPFPVGSWACNPVQTGRQDKGRLDLYDEDGARSLSENASVRAAVAAGPLKLKYPEGDPTLKKALEDLCSQVKRTTGIVLELSPCAPVQLREDVERTQSYDLAYYHYDFPDETYWLWPLLGPPLREGGDSNIFKFADDEIQPALQAVKRHRDFTQVREAQWTVHQSLMKQMPFIPLWQLDPLLAYSRVVKPAALDPQLVFTNIEEWRLQRK